ncbi:MAG: branched-chain amino acid ABC transporter permease [Clostridiales bacterium]|nr:branched-chain amino acid ABC transporter permease [Clostridiales bacterium]
MNQKKERLRKLWVSLLGVCVLGLAVYAADSLGWIDNYIRGIFIQCCFAIIMVTSLNLVMGYLGQIALGHAGFMAVGAYTSALVTKAIGLGIKAGAILPMSNVMQFFIGLLCGAVAAALFGLVVGIPALRLRGDYLAIITLGFGEIIRVIIQNLAFAGGKGLANGQAGQALVGILKMNDIYVIFGVTAVCVAIMLAFVRSKFGRAIIAIREDDIASSSAGLNITFYKVLTFTVSAFFAGIAGAIYAHRGLGTLQHSDFTFLKSTEYVIMVVLGGMGSMTGSVVAAIILSVIPEALRAFSQYRMLIYSVILVLMMIFRPIGLFGNYEFSLYELLRGKLTGKPPRSGRSAAKGGA